MVTSLIDSKRVGHLWRDVAGFYWQKNKTGDPILADYFTRYLAVENVLEVGCAGGSFLYLLSQRYPNIEFWGVDINKRAIDFGNNKLSEMKVGNVHLMEGNASNLHQFASKNFSLVFTRATLAHIPPSQIDKAISELLRVSNSKVVLVESHSFGLTTKELLKLGILEHHWVAWIRDYTKLLEKHLSADRITVNRIPQGYMENKPWTELGAIIEVKKNNLR